MSLSHPFWKTLSAANEVEQLWQYVWFHMREAAEILARAGEHERAEMTHALATEAQAASAEWWSKFRPLLVELAYPGRVEAPRELKTVPPPARKRGAGKLNNPFEKKRKVHHEVPSKESSPHETPA